MTTDGQQNLIEVCHPGGPYAGPGGPNAGQSYAFATPHTAEQLAALDPGFDFFEVKNNWDFTPLWDQLLQLKIPYGLPFPFCSCVDDLSNEGGCYNHTTVFADTPTKGDILANLKIGNSEASYGGGTERPHFSLIIVEGNQITIGTTMATEGAAPWKLDYHWYTDAGEVQTTLNVSQDTYTVTGDEMYVRLWVILWELSGTIYGQAWTNPFVVLPHAIVHDWDESASNIEGLFNIRLAG